MVEQRKADADFRGVIVNISSVSATEASINRGDYCISKAGIAMATQLWAHRLAEFGIAVYEVRPGIIHTDMTAAVAEKYDRLIAERPHGRKPLGRAGRRRPRGRHARPRRPHLRHRQRAQHRRRPDAAAAVVLEAGHHNQ